ncbi:1-deoxy-D-xylulose 5-phosphate synthase [hydrothermal vent metagenome]|uniref:1-deoxy-D-xylulose-5-phosphate synthase n=1 Tax=hydrothermal vent metagenome TaxID=652676 RepID=A0A3B1BX35_9ZZZZ
MAFYTIAAVKMMTQNLTFDLLRSVSSPADIKSMSMQDLEKLAQEVRSRIIDVVSKSGGHLASSLGVVELTIAMHYVYDAPADKIIWDVGHQCYAHKILTGRNDRFDTLRHENGVSGFPAIDESPYDCFGAGHAGTSISAALGFAQARDLSGKKNKVIAMIGDGSMTAGLAFEGLNHAGSLNTDITVVLNDNKMSISSNVGALSQHLNRIITGKWYVRMKKGFGQVIKSVAGGQVAEFTKRFEEAVKGVIVPGKLFEDLGYKYVGPIDGHEISYLVETFQAVKELKGPNLVHVVTTKGKGYPPAEKRSCSFHGVSPFHPNTGSSVKSKAKRSYTDVFANTLINLAGKDEKVIGITAAMPDGTGLDKFAEKFPKRFYDVGIAEQHATTFAAGLAVEGFRPVVAIYSTFLQRVFDQIVHDVCLMNLNVTFAVDRAGIVGEDGATHQGLFDLSYLRLAPNMVVMAPKDENELCRMLKTALYHPGPAALRYPRGSITGVEISEDIEPLAIGKSELLRDGSDICIIAVGSTVLPALEAACALSRHGYSAAVINTRFVKPIDEELFEKMGKKCGLLLTVEENVLAGGFGSAVLELIESKKIPHVAVRRIGVPDIYVSHGSQDAKRKELGLDAAGIEKTAREFIQERQAGKISFAHVEKTAGHPTY